MSGARLNAPQRACLLRAARIEIERLIDERERLKLIDSPGAQASVAAELVCLQSAVAWLWRGH